MNYFFTNYNSPTASEINVITIFSNIKSIIISYNVKLMRFEGSYVYISL